MGIIVKFNETERLFSRLSDTFSSIIETGLNPEIASTIKQQTKHIVTSLSNRNISTKNIVDRMFQIDQTLEDHVVGTCLVSALIGSLYFDKTELHELVECGLYHDVGKTLIPSHILNKPGKFTLQEYEIMKQHPIFGAQILTSAIESGAKIPEQAICVSLEHHERLDGSGYPYQKTDLSIFSQIVTIADVYSALAMKRVYQDGMDIDGIFKTMDKMVLNQTIYDDFKRMNASIPNLKDLAA